VEEEILGEGCIGLVKSIRRKSDSKVFAVKIVKTTDEEIVKNV
jgi:calcium/calmodulin-dependent protein kinase I